MPGRKKITPKIKGAARGWRLAVVALTLIITTVSLGCGLHGGRNSLGSEAASGLRPAGNTARLLRNAHYYKLMGRPELALKEFEQAYQASPDNYRTANVLAELYEEVGKFDRAQEIYREILAQDIDTPALANNQCFSYYLAGNLSDAEACFRRTLERQPGNTAARNNLGMVLCRQGRQEEARSLWQAAEGAAAADQRVRLVTAALGLAGPSRDSGQVLPALAGKEAAPARKSAGAVPPKAPSRIAPPEKPLAAATGNAPAGAPVLAAKPQASSREGYREETMVRISHAEAVPTRDPRVAAAHQPEEFRPAVSAPGPVEPRKPAAAPLAPASAGAGVCRAAPLTAEELEETAIEVRNGNGVPDLARKTRSRLDLEGFNVVSIANHIDFGANQTTIYYRPEAERVARALRDKFFWAAQLWPAPELADYLDVKVLLGRDLMTDQQVARRPGETV